MTTATAAAGYLVVVAKLLTPALDGGTDGDALPPSSSFNLDWMKQFPWPTQRPKIASAIEYLKRKGATQIGCVGFCYGGHPCCWASAAFGTDISCGVVFHPSMQLEQNAFGGSTESLLSSVQVRGCRDFSSTHKSLMLSALFRTPSLSIVTRFVQRVLLLPCQNTLIERCSVSVLHCCRGQRPSKLG